LLFPEAANKAKSIEIKVAIRIQFAIKSNI
jgi:hypothetical protein